MTKYLTQEEKEKIVQGALESIKDKRIRRICRLYMKGYSDDEIMGKLDMPFHELETYKSMIRGKLIEAGYKPKE